MIAKLHERYWIPRAVTIIKGIVSRCVHCRKYRAKLEGQIMADLPAERLQGDDPPFTRTGVDYFGPFEVKRGRTIVKRYGVIFTCLNIRAVHLEVAHSLDTDSCVNAIRRFLARRGNVTHIQSDNGTNFVGAERELREEIERWDQDAIVDTMAKKNIRWVFNPPSASHFGGVWERHIRMVRKVLYGLVKEQVIRMDDEGLATLFCIAYADIR